MLTGWLDSTDPLSAIHTSKEPPIANQSAPVMRRHGTAQPPAPGCVDRKSCQGYGRARASQDPDPDPAR